MGLIRKAISGTAAVATGGLSLAVVQFRSDTERAAHQTKKLRKAIERQGGNVGAGLNPDVVVRLEPNGQPSTAGNPQVPQAGQNDAVALPVTLPTQESPGWKADPEIFGQERFWNGKSWTSKVRAR